MNAIERFILQSLPSWYPEGKRNSRLAVDGRATWQVVNGNRIAAQFSCGSFGVLITDDDYYDGVSTWFYLIDHDGRIRDVVSTPDYFGFIEDIDIRPTDEIAFGFWGTNDRWTLRVVAGGYWSFGFRDLRVRINRFLLRKRYFSLSCHKGEPWIFNPTQRSTPADKTASL